MDIIDAKEPRRGPKSLYSQKLGELICYRIACGETLQDIAESESMPPIGTLRGWLSESKSTYQADFAKKYNEAKLKRSIAIQAGELPNRKSHIRYSDALSNRICTLLSNGKSLRQICALPDMPCYESVRAWLHPHSKVYKPEFHALYQVACEIKAEYYFDRIEELIDQPGVNKDEIQLAKFQLEALQIAASRNNPERFKVRTEITPQEVKLQTSEVISSKDILENPELRQAYAKIAMHQLKGKVDEF